MRTSQSELKNGKLNQVTMSGCYLFGKKLVKVTSAGINVCIVRIVANGKRIEAATKHLKSASPN